MAVGFDLSKTRAFHYFLLSISSLLQEITLKKLDIWKTTPSGLPTSSFPDAVELLSAFCREARPVSNGYDHVALFSGNLVVVLLQSLVRSIGYSIQRNGYGLGGLAYTGQMCVDLSCSVINAGYDSGYRSGYILAHELGHSLDMKHDGDTRCLITCFPDFIRLTVTPKRPLAHRTAAL